MWKLILKGAGAAMLVCAGGLLGWRKGSAAMRRARVLEEMHLFLGAVRDELHFRRGRTEEILLAAQAALRLSALPLDFSGLSSGRCLQEQLQKALQAAQRALAGTVQPEEYQLLRHALEQLGACPAGEEEQCIAHAMARLEALWKTARAQAQEQRRLYRIIGLSLGCAAALLLL